MSNFVCGDEKLRLTLEQRGSALWASLTDLAAGKQWPQTPLLALEVYDRMQMRLDRLTEYRIDEVTAGGDGLHVTVADGMRRVAVGLWMRIMDGELSVLLNPAELYEHKPALYRVFALDLLPGLMQVDRYGQMLLPLTTGILCSPADKPKLQDRFLIYGEQSRWELLPNLPVCAVQAPDGGLIALAVGAPAETECRVATDGQGNGAVGLGFFFRGHWPDPVEFSNREIRYLPTEPKADITNATARRLRRHIVDDLGKPTLRQRIDESPAARDMVGSYIMKLFYAMEKQGLMFDDTGKGVDPVFHCVMTFAEAKLGLKKLHDAGIDRIYTENVGWNARGHDGLYPTRFPLDERLGGEAGFRDLIAFAHALGGHRINVHDNYIDTYEVSPDFELETTVQDVYGQPQVRGFWAGGISYIRWPLAFSAAQLEAQMQRVKDLGVGGPYYLDGMGSPLYINYHPRHRGPRSDHARGIDRLLQTAKRIFGSVATESGFLYCSLTPDLVATPGGDWHLKLFKPDWPVTAMLGQRVPLWNLALSGLTAVENQAMDWPGTMQAILLAQHPRFEWSARPGIMPTLDDKNVATLKARYELINKRFGRLLTMQMTSWRREGKVESSTFEDGTTVIADFGQQKLSVDGLNVPRPEALAPAKA